MKRLAILGSTGSIGRQTIDVARAHPDLFRVEVLTASDNWRALAHDARSLGVDSVVIANQVHYTSLRDALSGTDIKVWAGADALQQVVQGSNIDVVVMGIVGFAALAPTVAALKASKCVALANKESLVAAGEIVMRLSREHNAPIIPVDSEHSAVFQCLVGESGEVQRLLLTASGGSLRDVPMDELSTVSAQRVLCHPVWNMGSRITVDSATMLNKGFEVIEAARLFGLRGDQIEVVIHPESIIHSMVEFADRSVKAQMSVPDMRGPIQYALTFPQRMELVGGADLDLFALGSLTFRKPDLERYPCLGLAYDALAAGGVMPCALNAAGEVAVRAFLDGKIRYTDIYRVVDSTLQQTDNMSVKSLIEIYESDASARRIANTLC